MKQEWTSIEEAAEDLGISERQAWRWLKGGKIKKVKDEDGQIVFILAGESTDTDVTTDMALTSVGDNKTIKKSILSFSGKQSASSLVQGLRDELESARVEFEIEKIEDARTKWAKRKNEETVMKLEAEQAQRLEELLVREQGRREEEMRAKARGIIQRIKEQIVPIALQKTFPKSILGIIYLELEKLFSRMDVIGFSEDELIVLGEGVRGRIIKENYEEVRQSICGYTVGLAQMALNQAYPKIVEGVRQAYREYMAIGGRLPYSDWIVVEFDKCAKIKGWSGEHSKEVKTEYLRLMGV